MAARWEFINEIKISETNNLKVTIGALKFDGRIILMFPHSHDCDLQHSLSLVSDGKISAAATALIIRLSLVSAVSFAFDRQDSIKEYI